MDRTLTVACVQTPPLATEAAAVAAARPLIDEAAEAGANLICLPEYCGGLATVEGRLAPPVAAEAESTALASFREAARAAGRWLLVGSLAIAAGGKFLNRSFLLAPDGSITARYDKIHLFDVDLSERERYRESDVVRPGAAAMVARVQGVRLGLSICYDLRFAALYRHLAHAGADLLAVPAAFTRTTGQAHWHILNRARAIETGSFVVSPCATGPVPGGGAAYGHSLIIDPWGTVLADGGVEPGIITATLDLEKVAQARARIPSLRHDRDFAGPAADHRAAS